MSKATDTARDLAHAREALTAVSIERQQVYDLLYTSMRREGHYRSAIARLAAQTDRGVEEQGMAEWMRDVARTALREEP